MTELARPFRIGSGSFGPADPVVIQQLSNNGIRGGEERLMLAVLQDAVECFQENVLSQQPWEKKLFQEAEDWILAKNSDWLFSFENICETLQLHPDYIRQGLMAESVSLSVAGLFHVGKTLAVGHGDDDSTDRWGDCLAIVGLWLAAKPNVLAGVGCGHCPAVSGS
jgi:hypothetical protein